MKSLTARPLVLRLKRPVIARIATITDWPLILIDLETEEGIVGRSYLEALYDEDECGTWYRLFMISARC